MKIRPKLKILPFGKPSGKQPTRINFYYQYQETEGGRRPVVCIEITEHSQQLVAEIKIPIPQLQEWIQDLADMQVADESAGISQTPSDR